MKKLFLTMILISQYTLATETTFISDQGFSQVWLWQLSNTTVNQEKGISLSKQHNKLYSNTQLLWTGKYINNNLYLGTAETASIIKIDNKYQEKQIFSSSNHALISAIAPEKDGLLISASPESKLYHLDKNHKQITNTTISNTYIWDIIPNPKGGFDILTGLRATVYSYSNYQLSNPINIDTEEHLLKGVYIDDTLWVLGEKGLYKKQQDKFVAIAQFEGDASGFVYTNNNFYILHTITIEANPVNNQAEQIISKLSRIDKNSGLIEELYSLEGSYFTSIHLHNKQIFIGADQYGLYIAYDLVTKKNYYANLGTGKILEIFSKGSELQMLTSDASALWSVGENLSTEGSFISEVYDANNTATWGQFSAQISTPPNTHIEFFIQHGVTENPEYWGDWIAINNNQKLPIPPTRYMRYKAVIRSDGKKIPYLHSIEFPYTELNIAPTIISTKIENKENTIYFSWSANDANKDSLEYDIWLAEDGLPSIKLNNSPIKNTNYTFTQNKFPAGMKKIKLVASDRPSNSDSTQLTAEFTSTPIMFDGENPMLTNFEVKKIGKKAIITFTAKDLHSNIHQVFYTINGKKQVRLLPIDGIFDQKEEKFSFEILNTEASFIQVTIIDSADNSATKGTTILPKTK